MKTTEINKYNVTMTKTGQITILAENMEEALRVANRKAEEDIDWCPAEATDAELDETSTLVETSYCEHIAIAVLQAQAMNNRNMNAIMPRWMKLAEGIQTLMDMNDEPRFTLYDYLDACINGSHYWSEIEELTTSALQSNDKRQIDIAFKRLVTYAEIKRNIYSK